MEVSEEELEFMLRRNPSLSISKNSVTKNKKTESTKNKNNPRKNPKYKNIKVYVYEDGFVEQKLAGHKPEAKEHGNIVERFDSVKEYNRWNELKLMEKAGNISDLRRQEPYELQPAFHRDGKTYMPIVYVADFVYKDITGQTVIEDVKGINKGDGRKIETKDFKLKWKIMMYQFPEIDFRIV